MHGMLWINVTRRVYALGAWVPVTRRVYAWGVVGHFYSSSQSQ